MYIICTCVMFLKYIKSKFIVALKKKIPTEREREKETRKFQQKKKEELSDYSPRKKNFENL